MSDLIGKTIVVTGATGLIGSNLVFDLLKTPKNKVIALARDEKKLSGIYKTESNNKQLNLIACDICDKLPEFDEEIDYVFHAAGPTAGCIIRETPVNVLYPNLLGLKNIIDFLILQRKNSKVNGRLIAFSSATVYGNYNVEKVVTEDDTSNAEFLGSPTASYSETKRMIEVIIKSCCKQFELDAVIARPSYVYGPSYYRPNTAFYEFIKKAINHEDIVLNNSNLARRDNIYIDDLISGLKTIAINGNNAEAYNLSSNKEMNNYIAVDEMAKIMVDLANSRNNQKISLIYKNNASNERLPGLSLDNSKAKKLGWQPMVDVKDGIAKTYEFYNKLNKI